MQKSSFLFLIILILLCRSLPVDAENTLGQELTFNVESSYDFYSRTELTATLTMISRAAYWYVDKAMKEPSEIESVLQPLVQEFEEKIYPTLTQIFGTEWSPGIDKDTRIIILIHPMKEKKAGYFDSADEYPKAQIPDSNEKEMVYLNSQYLTSPNAKSFLAHEFLHLITFNQKDKNFGISEDVWLNEARAEYAPTLLGYDSEYEGSNLQKRVKDFLNKPSDSLTEWRDFPEDYGVANLFIQYLVDHYGVQILADSLKMRQTGIESVNAVLTEKGFKEDFAQAFINWTIAVLVNDCQISEKYCYYNKNLKDLRVIPLINYLPFVGESLLSVTNTTKDWSGNWHKFIGGRGTLKIDFQGNNNVIFKVPYVNSAAGGDIVVSNFLLDMMQSGEIIIPDFGSETVALIIIPIAQNKIAEFFNLEPSRTFSWTAATQQEEEIVVPSLTPLSKPVSQMSRAEILSRIAEIQALIVKLQEIISQLEGGALCQSLDRNLYFGLAADSQVRCLQEFLKSQGSNIYPEAIVNGNFFTLTLQAVIRFQEKYAIQATGFVGPITRAKINALLTLR